MEPYKPYQTPPHVPDLTQKFTCRTYHPTDIQETTTHTIDTPISTLYNIQIGKDYNESMYIMYDGNPTGFGFDNITSRAGKLIGVRKRESYTDLNTQTYEWIIDKFGIPLTSKVNAEIEFFGVTRYTDNPPFSHSDIPYIPLVPESELIEHGTYPATYHWVKPRHTKQNEWIVSPESGSPITASRLYVSPVFLTSPSSLHTIMGRLKTKYDTKHSLSVRRGHTTKYQTHKFFLINLKHGTTKTYDTHEKRVDFQSHGMLRSQLLLTRQCASKIKMLNN